MHCFCAKQELSMTPRVLPLFCSGLTGLERKCQNGFSLGFITRETATLLHSQGDLFLPFPSRKTKILYGIT